MIIINQFPPIWDRANARFGLVEKNLKPIFAWGDKIYNPFSVPIPKCLIAHEGVHGDRQNSIGIEDWWECYLANDKFRLDEEVLAHRAEYAALLQEYGDNRTNRRIFLSQTATRLRAPFYCYKLPIDEARRLLKNCASE